MVSKGHARAVSVPLSEKATDSESVEFQPG